MLSKPYAGWTTVKIEDFSAPASYVTNVPVDCMEKMIHAMKTDKEFTVSFDAEGYEFKVISDYFNCFVIEDRDEPKLYAFRNIDTLKLAHELIQDIETYLEDWKEWEYSEEEDQEEYQENALKLETLLIELKKVTEC